MSMLSMPSLDRSRKPPSSCLRSTTSRGNAPAHARPIGGPFRLVSALGVVRTKLQVLSLSLDGGRYLSTFGSMARILAKF